MSETVTYSVRAIHCAQLRDVDLDTKIVTVHGPELDDVALRAAIVEAGYEPV